MEYGILNAMHIAHKFEHLLDTHRRPDGHRWSHELVQALRDGDVRDITRESARLPDRERQLILGIVRQFRDQKSAPTR
jgi:hypothetical protein